MYGSIRLKNLREHRQYYRHETNLTASFKNKDTSNFSPAKIVNISIVGAYLRSEEPLNSGRQIELSFQLPDRSKYIIKCSAKVIWAAQFKGYHGGVKFVDLKRIDRYRIAGFISNALRKKGLKIVIKI